MSIPPTTTQENEVGEIADGLDEFPIRRAPDLIQQDGQHDRRGEDEDQVQKANQQRVAQQPPEVG